MYTYTIYMHQIYVHTCTCLYVTRQAKFQKRKKRKKEGGVRGERKE